MSSSAKIALASRYADSPTIRALVQLVPFGIGSAVDLAVAEKVNAIREERARVFFDKLAEGEIEITQETIESEDFLHCYFATVSAALRSRRREKTALFADLLLGGVYEGVLGENDDYEELMSVMDDMSLREIKTLFIIDRAEANNHRKHEDDFTWVKRHMGGVSRKLRDELGIPKPEVASFIQRLSRTGLIEEVNMGDKDDRSIILSTGWETFRLTSRYRRLRGLLKSGCGTQ